MKLPIKISLITSIISIVFILFLFDNIQTKLVTSEKNNAIETYKKDIENIKDKIDLILNKTKSTLSVISISTTNLEIAVDRLKYRFEFYMKNIPEINSIKYIDIEGDELVSVSNKKLFTKLDTSSYLEKTIFNETLKNDFYISDIYYTDKNNEMMIDISRKVTDINSDDVIGIMIIQVSMHNIQEIISDKLIDYDAIALLDTNNNNFLYKSSQAQKLNEIQFLSSNKTISNIKTKDDNYFMVTSDYKNNQLNMRFFLLTKESNLFAHINEPLQENLLLLAITITLSSIIMFLIVTNIFKPLKNLTLDIKKLSAKIDKTDTKDEIEHEDEISEIKYYFDNFVRLNKNDKDKINNFNKTLQTKVDEEVEKNQVNQELLMQQSKMAAMGEMLESIAHQWRQPLSVITTSSSGLKIQKEYDMLNDEEFFESCDSIINSAEHLSETIDDFRNFFKQEKIKKSFNLKDVYKDTVNLLSSQFKNREIDIIETLEDVNIIGFGNELIQVYMNILNNAKDELETKDYRRLLFINIYKKDENVIINIKDNAGGIPIDIISKIFDAHFTTKTKKDGTGIGLYMSQEIINKSFNGTIEVKNETFKYDEIDYTGASFTITLPIV